MSKIIKCVALHDNPKVITPPQLYICDALPKSEAGCQLSALETAQPPVDQAETENLLVAAREEAARIIAEAQQTAEQLKADAYQTGFQQGFEQGTQEAQQAMQETAQALIAQAQSQAEGLMHCAESERVAMLLKAEAQIVEIALAVARKILKREVEENPMTVLPIVREALAKALDQDAVSLRVHPGDMALLEHAKFDLQTFIGGEKSLVIIPDPTISSGGCLIETQNGAIDATIDTQFAVLSQALRSVTV